jgi:hypothetical protein
MSDLDAKVHAAERVLLSAVTDACMAHLERNVAQGLSIRSANVSAHMTVANLLLTTAAHLDRMAAANMEGA